MGEFLQATVSLVHSIRMKMWLSLPCLTMDLSQPVVICSQALVPTSCPCTKDLNLESGHTCGEFYQILLGSQVTLVWPWVLPLTIMKMDCMKASLPKQSKTINKFFNILIEFIKFDRHFFKTACRELEYCVWFPHQKYCMYLHVYIDIKFLYVLLHNG